MKKINVAIVGATGAVGRKVINILHHTKFPINNIYAIASKKSQGKKISFGDTEEIAVENLDNFNFSKTDLVFTCAGNEISKKYVNKIIDSGAKVIDKSSYYRLKKNIPLIVPEINSNIINNTTHRIIANPNCVAIPLALVLSPLDKIYDIKHVVISTYQSVSGKGQQGMTELYEQTKSIYKSLHYNNQIFSKEIAFNIIPTIGDIDKNGVSLEEYNIEKELSKIMQKNLSISATCVRVPTFIGHAISLHIEFNKKTPLKSIIEILENSKGIKVLKDNNIITPKEIANKDLVFVNRIRNQSSFDKYVTLWVINDNLIKGAALNAVQIANNMIN